MRTIKIPIALLVIILFVFDQFVNAQEEGNKNVKKETRDLPAFTGINTGGALSVVVETTGTQSVTIETDENLLDKVKTEVRDDVLYIKSNILKNPTKLYAYITLSDFEKLSASGATDVQCPSKVENNEFHLEASGASSVLFSDVKFDYLESSISGAADVKMIGNATTHNLTVTGAGNFKGKGLVTQKTIYDMSGASDASLNVTDEVIGNKKGAASVSYTGNPKSSIQTDGSKKSSGSYVVYSDNYYDSVKVKVGGIKVEVYEGDDSVRVVVGNKELRVDEDGNVRFRRCKPNKFNGHWAGFELGLNGYVNPDFNMSFPKDYEYMDLRMTKSIVVNINVFEQNVPLSRNQKWGTLTGLGMSFNNYRFSRDTRLNSDSSQLIGYIDSGVSIRKSKLTTFYLNLPILFEFQTILHNCYYLCF